MALCEVSASEKMVAAAGSLDPPCSCEKEEAGRRECGCRCLWLFRARGLDPLCSDSEVHHGGDFFLRKADARAIEAADVCDSFEAWLKPEAVLRASAGFLAVAGSRGTSA